MNEKFNKNAKVEKLIKKVGRGVRLIVIGPYYCSLTVVVYDSSISWKGTLQTIVYIVLVELFHIKTINCFIITENWTQAKICCTWI